MPNSLQGKEVAKAFYGLGKEGLEGKFEDKEMLKSVATALALAIDDIIQKYIIVDWQYKIDTTKKMIHLIGDYLIDEVRDKYSIDLSFEEIDVIAEGCVNVAKIRYKK
jgi:type I restriction enzyme R subunit